MLAPTFTSPRAAHYRRTGGPWDLPSLDTLLTRVADPPLAEKVARVAGGLRAHGVGPGDAVAWQSANRDEVAVLFRACWRLGAVAAPVHHQMGAREVAGVMEVVQPAFVVDDLDALPTGDAIDTPWTDASQRERCTLRRRSRSRPSKCSMRTTSITTTAC